MNANKTISLLQTSRGVKTCLVKFRDFDRAYHYKTVDSLEIGDLVVVEASGDLKIATVVDLHITPSIRATAWVIDKVDTDRLEAIKAEELALEELLLRREAERSLQAALGADLGLFPTPVVTALLAEESE